MALGKDLKAHAETDENDEKDESGYRFPPRELKKFIDGFCETNKMDLL